MPLRVAIIGLGQIGSSMGLAYSKYPEKLTCVGYDDVSINAKAALKVGAITKGYHALKRCINESKVIILACPVDEVKRILSIVAEYALEGSIIIDTSPVKTQVAEWAQEILPESIFFTGWTLALNIEQEIKAAREDLFSNSMIGINATSGTPGEALTLNSDLVYLLGAKPFFLDSIEADGLIAMGHELPRVAALALLLATVDSSGWLEARKLAGANYAKATLPVMSVIEREELGMSMLINRDNIVRLIDDLIRSLWRVRGHLEADDAGALKEDLEHTIQQRLLWLEQRQRNTWSTPNQVKQLPVERQPLLGNWLKSRITKGKDS